jgi:hypothetical protein
MLLRKDEEKEINICRSEWKRQVLGGWGGVVNNKLLNIDEGKSYKKVISCRKTGELKHLGKCLYRRKCKRGSIGN